MRGDPDLLAFRRTYYDLLVALLAREPAPALLCALGETVEDRTRAAHALHPLLGEGWEEIGQALDRKPVETAAKEAARQFSRLFVGPFAPLVNPYESYYLTGKLFERPLAEVRAFLVRAGIEREAGYHEPEDSLTFELEVVRQLVGRQAAEDPTASAAPWLELQVAFLKDHLLVWGPACALDLDRAAGPGLYRGAARLLRGFLALERDLVTDGGAGEPRSLEEAQAGHRRGVGWRGPLLESDLEPPPTGS